MASNTVPKTKLSIGRSLQSLAAPVMMSRSKADALSKRIAMLGRAATSDSFDPDDEDGFEGYGLPSFTSYEKLNGIATIPIVGTLTKYPEWYDKYCGFVPALGIQANLNNAVSDPSIRSITLLIDCPGGYCDGTYELSEAIVAANKIKPVNAIVSGMAASGGYLLAAMARSIRANDAAFVGCMGVCVVLCDDSKYWEDMGIVFTVIDTGGVKGDGLDGKITQALKDEFQREINGIYELFISRVAAGRDMDESEVRKLADGKSYIASEAKQLGLIDQVASLDASMAAILQETQTMTLDEFNAFAKANPTATKSFYEEGFTAGKTAGITEGSTNEQNRFKALNDKFGKDRSGFVCEQFSAGADLPKASQALTDVVLAENASLKEQVATGKPPEPRGQQPLPNDYKREEENTPVAVAAAAKGKEEGEAIAKKMLNARGLK